MKQNNAKTTVLIICMGFLLIHLISDINLFLYLSLGIGILGVSDKVSKLIDKFWMGLTKILSYIVPNILLTLVFYLVLLPFAFIYKIIQKDPLLLSPDHKSYWVRHDEQKIDPKSFEKTW